MKSILVIGMGKLGKHLSSRLIELGNEVVIADKDSKSLEDLDDSFTDVIIGDCTNENVLMSLGVNNFDICFVTVGENFQASLEITSLLKDMGAKNIISKAKSDRQANLLRKIGATEVFYPEKEIANKLAVQYSAKNIFDFIELNTEYAIFEIPILEKWAGNSIAEINIRRKYHVNIIAIKHGNTIKSDFDHTYIFNPQDHIVVIGKANDVFKLVAKTE